MLLCARFGVSLYRCVRGCDVCAICLSAAVRLWSRYRMRCAPQLLDTTRCAGLHAILDC
jgi:hypothetical protein